MDTKYSREFVCDITQTFIQNQDFDFIQKKMYEGLDYPLPHKISCYMLKENSGHGIVDENALASLGEQLLNCQLFADVNAYHLTLPSVNEAGSNHAVALMIDLKEREIWYQDSYGIDMRKELRDFFKLMFPGCKIGYNPQIQQYKQQNDHSCFLLAQYNILDMWHRKAGHLNKLKEFDSRQARADVWQYVRQIPAELPKPPAKATFKFGTKKAVVLPKKYLLEQRRNTERDFKYCLPKQKNYKEMLAAAVCSAEQKHQAYRRWLLEKNLLNGRRN